MMCGVLGEDSCGGDYIFLKTDAGAANALPYKATLVPPGYGISPKVVRPMQAFQFIEPLCPNY